ncbi:MAG: vitamin K epoxide reductase family protein [bacterium]
MTARIPTAVVALSVPLAIIGAVLAGYLAIENLQGQTGVCVGVHGCSTVQNSRYGKPFGVPISIPGLLGYLAMLALAIAWLRDFQGRRLEIAFAGFLAAFAGVLVSGYLTYIEGFVVDAWCSYCIVSALLMVGLFAIWSGILVHSMRE